MAGLSQSLFLSSLVSTCCGVIHNRWEGHTHGTILYLYNDMYLACMKFD